MSQITIYLEDALEEKVRLRAKQQGISVSKWIATAIEAGEKEVWPAHVIASFGTWDDVTDSTSSPIPFAQDAPRVSLD